MPISQTTQPAVLKLSLSPIHPRMLSTAATSRSRNDTVSPSGYALRTRAA